MEALYKKIGERIRFYRRKKGLSQLDLANAIDSTQSYIYLVEKGKIRLTLENLLKISEALGVPASDLAPEFINENISISKIPKDYTLEDILDWFKSLPKRKRKEILSKFIQLV
ncbi:helix-turn-helix domain-containing protein [Persephonella sp.]